VPYLILKTCGPLLLFTCYCPNITILYLFLTLMFMELIELPLFSSYLLEFLLVTFLNYDLISFFVFLCFLNECAYWINLLISVLNFEFVGTPLVSFGLTFTWWLSNCYYLYSWFYLLAVVICVHHPNPLIVCFRYNNVEPHIFLVKSLYNSMLSIIEYCSCEEIETTLSLRGELSCFGISYNELIEDVHCRKWKCIFLHYSYCKITP